MGFRKPTEASFQATLERVATLFGWELYHTHDSRRSLDGFPDAVLGRDDRYKLRLVVAELKRPGEKPTASQEWWLDVFRTVTTHVYVWTAKDWTEIERILMLP